MIVTRCDVWSTATEAIDGSATVAAIGLIAEPTVRSSGEPTGTDADSGETTIGGGVAMAGVGVGSGGGDGAADGKINVDDGVGAGEAEGAGEADGDGVGDGAPA